MRISDWSSDVCSSDLRQRFQGRRARDRAQRICRGQRRGAQQAAETGRGRAAQRVNDSALPLMGEGWTGLFFEDELAIAVNQRRPGVEAVGNIFARDAREIDVDVHYQDRVDLINLVNAHTTLFPVPLVETVEGNI